MRRKPYPEYSESAVPWVGVVPKHWASSRVKFVTSLNDDVLAESTDPGRRLHYVDIGNVDATAGIIGAEAIAFGDAPSRARRLVRNGDVIVSTVRTYLRAITGIEDPDPDLVISTGFAVLRPKPALSPRFAAYAFKAPYFVDRVVAHSVGVSYPAINPSVLASLKVVVPPLDEQRAIAAFLDRETARIDALIANKHRQIELLQEKRQAVITQAVTRGLDPNAPMKDSGVEWIGEIPADWQVKRLKYISLHVTVGIVVTPAKFYVAEGIPCLRSLNVRDGSLTDNNLVFISPESHDNHAKSRLRTGDIVAVRSGHPGSAAVVDDRYDDANCIDLIIIRRSRTFEPQFLAYAMASQCVRSQFEAGSGGAIQQHFNIETANNLLIALPPLATQIAIRSSLDKELGDLRALEGSIAQSVATLLEYRTALISAAVTGKIDVRDTAAVQRHTAPLPFRRVVLGAEIIQRLLDDPHFGRTKFEKALYLCEHHLGIELEGTYRRKAAGPLDGRMLYGMEAMLARQKWYGIDESPGRVRYVPLEKAGAHDRYFERYWGQHREALDTFLALFRQLHTERCEIVATLYAAWNDLVLTGGYFTDADIIREVRERWHERKERFTEDRLQRALGWMRKHGLVPTGRGRPTLFNGTDAATGEPS